MAASMEVVEECAAMFLLFCSTCSVSIPHLE
jgi:hypothetical protein